MDQVVVDANVVVKLFVEEDYSKNARDLRNSYIEGSIQISVPSLLYYEVMNAILFTRKLSLEGIELALRSIAEYDFIIINPDHNLNIKIIRLAKKYNISVYDATYVGLALATNSILYTSDAKLIKSVDLPNVKHIKEFKSNA